MSQDLRKLTSDHMIAFFVKPYFLNKFCSFFLSKMGVTPHSRCSEMKINEIILKGLWYSKQNRFGYYRMQLWIPKILYPNKKRGRLCRKMTIFIFFCISITFNLHIHLQGIVHPPCLGQLNKRQTPSLSYCQFSLLETISELLYILYPTSRCRGGGWVAGRAHWGQVTWQGSQQSPTYR